MAKRDTDTAASEPSSVTSAQPPLANGHKDARDRFINRCLHDWGLGEFLADKGCDPNEGHVQKLIDKAGRVFDRLFAKRPITDNL